MIVYKRVASSFSTLTWWLKTYQDGDKLKWVPILKVYVLSYKLSLLCNEYISIR